MKPIRVGIIGAGGVAQKGHIPSYQRLRDVEVVGIYDPNKVKMDDVAKKFNIQNTFTDYRSLLELDELDVVSVCSPNFLHAEQSIASLEAEKHVLCDKPVAINTEEAEAIIRAVRQSKRKFMVAFCHRFDLPFHIIKNFVDRDELGEIYYAKSSYLRRSGVPGLGSWFTTKKLSGGGPLLDIGIHMLDMSLWMMGNPEPASVMASTYDKLRDKAVRGDWPPKSIRKWDSYTGAFDVEDLATAIIKFKNGSTLFLEASWTGYSETGLNLSLFGTKGGVEFKGVAGGAEEGRTTEFTLHKEIGGELVDLAPNIPPETRSYWDYSFPRAVKHFIECIRTDEETITKPQEILNSIKIVESIYASAEKGKAIEL